MLSVPLNAQHVGVEDSSQGPWVILHGLLGSSRNWGSCAKKLGVAASVWLLDMRNHGASPHASPSTYAAMVEDVRCFLEVKGLHKVRLMGHSMGGKVAMAFACQCPESLERLVIVDIAPKAYAEVHYAKEFKAMATLPLSMLSSRKVAEAHMAPFVEDAAHLQFLLTNLVRNPAGGFCWQINLPALTAALPHLATNPLQPSDRYLGPTLFIRGGRSHFIDVGDAALIKQYFPQSSIVTLSTAGHNPHVDSSDDFIALINQGV